MSHNWSAGGKNRKHVSTCVKIIPLRRFVKKHYCTSIDLSSRKTQTYQAGEGERRQDNPRILQSRRTVGEILFFFLLLLLFSGRPRHRRVHQVRHVEQVCKRHCRHQMPLGVGRRRGRVAPKKCGKPRPFSGKQCFFPHHSSPG